MAPLTEKEQGMLTMALIGFCAYSVPLLIYDTKGYFWGSSSASIQVAGDSDLPPSPPSWAYHDDDPEESAFRLAVSEGDLAKAKDLVDKAKAKAEPKDLVSAPHWHGSTPLFEAARSGKMDVAKWLVEQGADPDHANEWGDSPAQEAASMGHWDVVWYLADAGANLSRTHEHAHSNIVLSAVRHRDVNAMRQLRTRGVELDMRGWNGNTALHEAARTGETEMVQFLLGAEANMDVNATNDQGDGAVHEAALMGHTDTMWALIKAGADLGRPNTRQSSGLVNSAVRHSNVDLLGELASHGIDVTGPDEHGRRPVIEAVRESSNHDDTAVLDWLLQHGGNASITSSDHGGESASAIAAQEGKFQHMWRLHEAGADLKDVRNEFGGTVLMSAVHHDRLEDVRRLLQMGLDTNAHNDRGDTPMVLAAGKGNVEMMQLLMSHGARHKSLKEDSRADTPLIRAARFRRVDAVRFLLDEHMGSVNEVTHKGETALMAACKAGGVGVATLLLERGASVNQKQSGGKQTTAVLEACDSGSVELVKLLHAKGADLHATNGRDHEFGCLELARYSHTSHSDELVTWLEEQGVKERDRGHGHGEPFDEHDEPEHH